MLLNSDQPSTYASVGVIFSHTKKHDNYVTKNPDRHAS